MDTTIRKMCNRAISFNSLLNHLHRLFNVRVMLPKSILIDRLTPSAALERAILYKIYVHPNDVKR